MSTCPSQSRKGPLCLLHLHHRQSYHPSGKLICTPTVAVQCGTEDSQTTTGSNLSLVLSWPLLLVLLPPSALGSQLKLSSQKFLEYSVVLLVPGSLAFLQSPTSVIQGQNSKRSPDSSRSVSFSILWHPSLPLP